MSNYAAELAKRCPQERSRQADRMAWKAGRRRRRARLDDPFALAQSLNIEAAATVAQLTHADEMIPGAALRRPPCHGSAGLPVAR